MSSVFERFAPRLREAIVSRLGWTSLRPVQELAGHALLDGENAVILAPTAGGKTEAAIFPLLSQLIEAEPEGVGLLYLAPIKALLNNQAERLGTLTGMVGLRRFLWHGDVTTSRRRSFIREPAELLMTTPESLEVMLLSSRFPHARLFADVRAVVIDEIHALAGTDRGAHLMSVLERIARHSRHDIQRAGLSATVGNPEAIALWLRGTSRRPGRVIDPPREPSPKDLRVLLRPTVSEIALEAARQGVGKKSLFFCQSPATAEGVAERLLGREIDVFVHHSSVSLEERQRAEAHFVEGHRGGGKSACIVCTSTLELGIDVGDLDLVFQADAPSTVSAFLQRLGHTGRRPGTRAHTTFLCEHPEAVLQATALIELARRGWVEPVRMRRSSWAVLVHQLLALTLGHGALRPADAWEILSTIPNFAGITTVEYEALVKHLVREGYLWSSAGRLSIGDETERVFGRRNFMELYAVFTSPQLYRVTTETGREVGHLEQTFVDKLVEEMSAFLLGGRAWSVVRILHADRRIKVVPAPRGRKPSWGGFLPQILGEDLCQEMARLLTDDRDIPYADSASRTALEAMRDDLGPVLRRSGLRVQTEVLDTPRGGSGGDSSQRLLWWTYAGGQINHALRYGLTLLEPDWTLVADNRLLRIEGPGASVNRLADHLSKLGDEAWWSNPDTQERLLANLPEYRLSKFQRALPRRQAMELVRDELLDIAGAARVCGRVLEGEP